MVGAQPKWMAVALSGCGKYRPIWIGCFVSGPKSYLENGPPSNWVFGIRYYILEAPFAKSDL